VPDAAIYVRLEVQMKVSKNGSRSQLLVVSLLMIAGMGVFAATASAQDAAGVYKTKCAACHGADGKGATPAGKNMGVHDFASPEVAKETDEQLIEVVTKGRNKMPPYGNSLKEPQIKDLVGYIRDLAKK
jgi:cytochrome c6